MPESISFGTWLRQQRRALDLTQKAFAAQVGCAEITLRRMEAGEYKPSSELVLVLLEKLGIPELERSQWVHFARGLSGFPLQPTSPSNKPLSNLPAPLTTFIGREKEQSEVIRLITKYRLVTLTGSGGVGKSRLSIKVGEQVLKDYDDGVWLLELASLSDPMLLPQTVAALFGITRQSDIPFTDLLINFLRAKSILLIFDNCEHLANICAQLIETLLVNCPYIRILATSRDILHVEGAVTYNTPPLSIPEIKVSESVNPPTKYESIQLFSERAELIAPFFTLTDNKAIVVVNICRRLDGIPLAIELAAAHVDVLQVDEILEQLKHCFDLLVSNSHAVLPRHQTMRASMDWSWSLLNEQERMFMRQLSAFAGGWILESAKAVCDGDVLNLTRALVRKSLIVVNQEAASETRYRFHEVIRQYARERLVETNEEAYIRTQHLKYYLALSERAEPALRGPSQVKWLVRLNDERDNLRTALEWAAINDVEAGLYLTSRLQYFWENFDSLEGSLWLAKFIEKPESKAYPLARAKALCTQGWFLHWNQQLIAARSVAQECLDIYQECSDKQGEVEALLLLASAVNFLGNARQGEEFAKQALALAQSLDDTWRQAKALVTLGWTEGRDIKSRVRYWEKAITLFRKVGDLRFLAGKLGALGSLLALNGDIESAQKYLDESTLLVQQLSPKNISSHQARDGYVQIALMRGDYEQARGLLQNSEEISKESGDRMSYLWARVRLGQLDLREGNITKAHHTFVENAQIFQKDQNKDGVVFTLERIASVYIIMGKPERAARLIGWSNATRAEISVTRPYIEQADVDRDIAACLAKMGEVAFSDAYDEGQKMTMDEAVTYALKEN